LISGRYLGEILRLVICELIDEGVLFLGQNTYKLEISYALDTAFLSLMESDPTEELLMIIGIFSHFFALETTLAERQFFRALAKLVGRRAARLSSCGIAAIVSKMGYLDSGCSVGADGSLYNVRPVSLDRLSPGGMREQLELMITATVSRRNILASRIACTRACRTSLARKAGESLNTDPLFFPKPFFFTLSP
jgi:hexokinase